MSHHGEVRSDAGTPQDKARWRWTWWLLVAVGLLALLPSVIPTPPVIHTAGTDDLWVMSGTEGPRLGLFWLQGAEWHRSGRVARWSAWEDRLGGEPETLYLHQGLLWRRYECVYRLGVRYQSIPERRKPGPPLIRSH